MTLSSLDTVLAYENDDIIDRFIGKFGVTRAEAREIFTETKKMMWLMATRRAEFLEGLIQSPVEIKVYRQMAMLDEMWHNFILFSREYFTFCKEHLGGYLHHSPTTAREKARTMTREEIEAEARVQCGYIVDKLGSDTLVSWFRTLPARFPTFIGESNTLAAL